MLPWVLESRVNFHVMGKRVYAIDLIRNLVKAFFTAGKFKHT